MAISPEQLQQAVQQSVATAVRQWPEAAQMHQEIGTLRTQVQGAQAVPLPRDESKSGGYATVRKTRVLRQRRRLEGSECCLQKLCECLLCTAWLSLGAIGEISWTDAQRDADAVRSIELDTAVLHVGDVVQGYCSDSSGECWSTGVLGVMEVLGLASRTDLADTQCGSVARVS